MSRVLVIEDDEFNRQVLEQLLEDEFDVFLAADGGQGIFAAIDHRPDVILLDLSMPRMGGWSVVETLSSDHRTENIPVIIMTGHTDGKTRLKAHEMGCAGFVAKPYNADEILGLVQRIIGSRVKSETE